MYIHTVILTNVHNYHTIISCDYPNKNAPKKEKKMYKIVKFQGCFGYFPQKAKTNGIRHSDN